jgi:hypothetical protein
MAETEKPSAEGLKRYPYTAGYNVDTVVAVPCQCKPSCKPRCAGECGCEACTIQFATFFAMTGIGDVMPTPEGEQVALARYRNEC